MSTTKIGLNVKGNNTLLQIGSFQKLFQDNLIFKNPDLKLLGCGRGFRWRIHSNLIDRDVGDRSDAGDTVLGNYLNNNFWKVCEKRVTRVTFVTPPPPRIRGLENVKWSYPNWHDMVGTSICWGHCLPANFSWNDRVSASEARQTWCWYLEMVVR